MTVYWVISLPNKPFIHTVYTHGSGQPYSCSSTLLLQHMPSLPCHLVARTLLVFRAGQAHTYIHNVYGHEVACARAVVTTDWCALTSFMFVHVRS